VPHGKPRRGAGPPLHFQIDGFRDVTSPLDLLGASPADRAAAEQKIQELSKEPDGIYNHIKETLERCFQVVSSACSERHKDMQRFTVLQALSAGQVNAMTSDRLSCLVVSASGVGKKILVLYGKALSAVCAEVEPHNFTAAGLTTVQEQREGGERLCHPGALPESDGGAFFLSDAHRVPKGPLTATLRGSLMTVCIRGWQGLPHQGGAGHLLRPRRGARQRQLAVRPRCRAGRGREPQPEQHPTAERGHALAL
jgi:hypothetical protein